MKLLVIACSLMLSTIIPAAPRPHVPPQPPTVIIQQQYGDVFCRVIDHHDGRFEYLYVTDRWPTSEEFAEYGMKLNKKSGEVFLFDEDGKVARRFFKVKGGKLLSLSKGCFRVPMNGKIELQFISRGAPKMGYFQCGYSWISFPEKVRLGTARHRDCPVPSRREK